MNFLIPGCQSLKKNILTVIAHCYLKILVLHSIVQITKKLLIIIIIISLILFKINIEIYLLFRVLYMQELTLLLITLSLQALLLMSPI